MKHASFSTLSSQHLHLLFLLKPVIKTSPLSMPELRRGNWWCVTGSEWKEAAGRCCVVLGVTTASCSTPSLPVRSVSVETPARYVLIKRLDV